jgi:hypothetical protein
VIGRILAALLVLGGMAHATATPPPVHDVVDGGDHIRIVTEHGVMHLWCPPGYDPRRAGIVVYVHGYYTDADQAWTQHKLADQFLAANKNAVFIVAEAPIAIEDDVKWASLGDLLRAAFEGANLQRPDGAVIVVGHSAAYRTVVPWLAYTPLEHMILLDAMYGNEEDYYDWLERSKGHASHRLTIVGEDTSRWAEPFVKRFPKSESLPQIPKTWDEIPDKAKVARVLYIKSQLTHMAIVTEGQVLPLILQRAPLRDLVKKPKL